MFQKNKFLVEEMPFEKFQLIGLDRNTVLALPKDVLVPLVNGRMTPIIQANITGDKGTYVMPMRLQLVHDAEGNVQLMTCPLHKEIVNTLNLSTAEIDRVSKGEVIRKEVKEKDGTRRQKYIQLDPETKSLMYRDTAALQLHRELAQVEKVKDIQLGTNQKQAVQEGKPVELNVGDQKVTVGVDLRQPNGFKVVNGDMEEWKRQAAIRYDVDHPEVIGYVQTDRNRWEYRQIQLRQQEQSISMDQDKNKKSAVRL
jgi:hypothetical protein